MRSAVAVDVQPTADNEYLTSNERCLSSRQLIISENEAEIVLDVSPPVQFSGRRMQQHSVSLVLLAGREQPAGFPPRGSNYRGVSPAVQEPFLLHLLHPLQLRSCCLPRFHLPSSLLLLFQKYQLPWLQVRDERMQPHVRFAKIKIRGFLVLFAQQHRCSRLRGVLLHVWYTHGSCHLSVRQQVGRGHQRASV